MKVIQKPNKMSRKVQENDLVIVRRDAKKMFRLCKEPLGRYPAALAIAHVQVEPDDPLRFFVTQKNEIVINPKILNKFGKPFQHPEGCYSYAYRETKKVKRYPRVEVQYTLIDKGGERKEITKIHDGMFALVFQHEIDHMNNISIY